jgi:hypothetical protein
MIRIGVDTGGTFTDLVRFAPRASRCAVGRRRTIRRGRSSGHPDDAAPAAPVHGSTVAVTPCWSAAGARGARRHRRFEDVVTSAGDLAQLDLMQEDGGLDPALTAAFASGSPRAPLIPLDGDAIARVVAPCPRRRHCATICLLHA